MIPQCTGPLKANRMSIIYLAPEHTNWPTQRSYRRTLHVVNVISRLGGNSVRAAFRSNRTSVITARRSRGRVLRAKLISLTDKTLSAVSNEWRSRSEVAARVRPARHYQLCSAITPVSLLFDDRFSN